MRRPFLFVLAVFLLYPLSSVFSQQPTPAAESAKPAAQTGAASELETWRRATTAAPPAEAGCYQVDYPAKVWRKIDCGPAPADPPRTIKPPKRGGQDLRPEVQLITGDYTMTPTNKITSATGQVATLNQVTSVGSVNANNGVLSANLFSLQVNSNNNLAGKTGSLSCTSSTNTGCTGWIQFVYNSSRQLYIQEWFINYLSNAKQSCPSGLPFSSALSCGKNVVISTLASTAPSDFTKMQGASLTGQALSNGNVVATLTAGGTSYVAAGTDGVGTASGWTSAEFNVFGFGTNSSGAFNTVQLNTAAQVTMGLTSNNDSSRQQPGCTTGSTTAENSNMFLGPCNKTTAPGISFNESPTPPCTFSESCPFFQNQPPTYSATCAASSDFYTTGDIHTPSDFTLVAQNVLTNTGSTTGEAVSLAACQQGSKTVCNFYSIDVPSSQWCHGKITPPPACTKCGAGQKCCANPDGGGGTICVSSAVSCPVIH